MENAKDIMSNKIISVESDTTGLDIAKLMNKNRVGSIIITKNQKPVGIITERDLISKIISQNQKASDFKAAEIMSLPLVVISPSTPIDEIAEKMIFNKIRHVAVLDGNETVGIITVSDFVKHFHSILSSDQSYNKKLYQDLIEDWEYWAY